MIKHQMFIAAALLAGVAIGYFVKDEPIAAEEPAAETVQKKAVADKGEEASVKALRHRIAELEKLLAEKDGTSEIAISNAVAEAVKARPPAPPQNWRERMEEMKKNDPERYTQMTNRFAQWRMRRAAEARGKMDFLASIDTSRMSGKAKKTHDELQELLAKREDIEERLHQEGLSDDQRHQLMGELHATNGELWRLNGQEQKNLISEMTKELGFTGEDAAEVSGTVQAIIDATSNFNGFRPPHHGGGSRGPGRQGGR